MKKSILLLALACFSLFSSTAIAATPIIIESTTRDGFPLIVKTFEVDKNIAPDELIEEPFELDGFQYKQLEISKTELSESDAKNKTETISFESSTKDMESILRQLSSSIEYDNEGYKGTLILDHTSINVEVLGYTTKSSKITSTREFSNLMSNDPSYVPQTDVKDGKILNLSNIEWTVLETTLVGDSLVPVNYMALATYQGTVSSQIATGYVITARYSGEVLKNNMDKVQYVISYLGKPIADGDIPWIPILSGIILCTVFGAAILMMRRRQNVIIYELQDEEYVLVSRMHLKANNPVINLHQLKNAPTGELAIVLKSSIAKKLFGRRITTILPDDSTTKCIINKREGDFWYRVEQGHDNDEDKEVTYGQFE